VLKLLSLLPAVADAKARTAVEPFADGEWLLVYGSRVAIPGPNANVLKHMRSDADVSRAIADAGLAASDAGVGAVHAELYGVKDVLLRPQPQMFALVPSDRASELNAALARPVPIDPGLKAGEMARFFLAEPAKVARFLPADVVKATVIVKPAADGGFDLAADADCADAASCRTTATALEDLLKRSNTLMVKIVSKDLLGGVAVAADGAKLRATLHVSPDQVDTLSNLARAELGLPAASATAE
jgi:hypothetical protein